MGLPDACVELICRGRKITKKGQKDLDLVATTLTAPASEW